MKKAIIRRNFWTSHETYFVDLGLRVHTGKMEAKATGGYSITRVDGEWVLQKEQYYCCTIKDEENFPVVGYIDVKDILINATLNAIIEFLKGEKMDEEVEE